MKTRLLHFLKVMACLAIVALSANKTIAQTYCTPSYFPLGGGCGFGDDLNTFTLAGEASTSINDPSSGCATNSYEDSHLTMSVTLYPGSTYTAYANTTGGFLADMANDIQIFIDFNDDGTFSSSESVGGGGPLTTSLGSYVVTIPAGATLGSHRMRVVADGTNFYPSCDPCPNIITSGAGEVHDYTAVISTTVATCTPVTAVTMSAITSASATLSWSAVTGAVGYEWTVDNSPSAPTGAGTATTATTANATGLTASTTYYAHVRVKCSATSYSTWVTTTFTTTAVATCTPVTAVNMSAITAASATLTWAAVTGAIGYEWTVDNSPSAPTGAGTATTATTANATGLTASTAYYAHVRVKCSATSFSTWVTTSFTTIAPGACTAPTVTLGASTTTTQVINWTAVAGATGYEWTVDMVATAPTVAGTATTATTATATGLTASTSYYAHVRTICSATSSSSWTTIPFTTAPVAGACAPVTGLTASSITTTSALISWTAVAGSLGYEYLINTSPASPAGSGTITFATNTVASGLTPATTYYAHVRDSCGPGNFSTWTTIPFTTLSASCAPVTALSASAINTSSATVSWAVISGTAGYEYVIDNTVTTPPGSGTNITATSYAATGLTAATTYYAHVRDSCSTTSFSAWNTIPFTTLSATCNAPTGLAVSGITTHSATVSWTSPAGTLAAQYVINTIAADPAGSGTSTGVTVANPTGLLPATMYYAHVRDSCGPTALSAWVTIPFYTLPSGVGVVNINEAGAFSITAYPNPVREMLTVEIQGNTNGAAQIQLMDVTGKLIKIIPATGITISVDMNGLSSGLYLIRYIDTEHTQTIKVSKQ